LLSLVKDAFATQSLEAPAAACAAALAHAAHVARGTVKEDATTLLEDAAKAVVEELDKTLGRVDVELDTDLNKDSPPMFALSAAVCRAAALAQVHPAAVVKEGDGGRTVGDCMSRILDIAAMPKGLLLFGTGVVVLAAAKTMLLGTMLSLSKARVAQSKRSEGDGNTGEDNTNDGNEAVTQLAADQAVLGSQLQGILLSPDPPQGDAKSAKLGAALVLADFLTIFAPQTLPSTLLPVAAYKPSVPVINAFWSVMEGEILSGDVEKVIKAVETVAKLCCGPFDSDGLHELGEMLASKLLSHWTSPPFVLDKTNGQDDGDEYAEATNPVTAEVMNSAIKETLKWAKSNTGSSLPGIYLNALIEAYDRSKRQVAAALASQSITQDDANDDAVALGPLLDLSQRLAGSHAGLNVPASVVAHVARDGAIWAIRGGPERIDFLQGVSFFMIKLKGSAAVQVLEAIEEVGASCIDATTLQAENVREEEGEWDLYFQYCDALRAAASRPIGGAARGGVRQGREKRISFGENLGNQENQENEEDAGDDIMPTEEELPPVNEDDEEDDEDVPRVAARKRRGRRS